MLQVFVNLHSAHMDPDDWQQPQQFRPERFLDESGNVVGKDRVITFSLGTSTAATFFSVRPLSHWKLISKFMQISSFRRKISSAKSQLSKEINFKLIFRT